MAKLKGYKDLKFIDKIKYYYRVWQEERAEDERQAIEHDDRISTDTQKIVDDLLAERAARQNKKNNVRFLPDPKDKPIQRLPNTLEQYKVSKDTIQASVDIFLKKEKERFERMVTEKCKNKDEACNIIAELTDFSSYPHDYIPDMATRIAAKFHILKVQFGENIIDTGLKIYENDKLLKDRYNNISFEDHSRMEEEISYNRTLSKQLSNARYQPKDLKHFTEEFLLYQAVFSNMKKNEMYKKFSQQNETSNELDEIA